MIKANRWIAVMAAAIMMAPATKANDSAAAIGAGGIELRQQGDVRMVSEDLYVSRPKIRVRYEFRNEGQSPVTTLVAFPLPELDLAAMGEGDIGWPSDNKEDPTGFKVQVDGKSVSPKLERKAVVNGKDVTADLQAAGVPVNYPFGDFWDRVKSISRAKVDALEAKKIVFVAPETREVQALWTVKNTYYWEQTFPPGKIVTVEHTYAPVVGGSFWYDEKFTPETLAKHDLFKDFCIDQGTLNAIRAREAAVRAKHKVDLPLSYLDIRYILKTGRNWKGPIGSFKLTVDKGAPDNVVSFCGEGVTKSGPTTFVMQKTNWEPDADLAVIILAAQNL